MKINKTGRPAVIECDNQNQVESLYVRQHIATLDDDELLQMNEALIQYQGLRVKNQDEISKLQNELSASKKLNERLLNILEIKENENAANDYQTKGFRRRAKVSESAARI